MIPPTLFLDIDGVLNHKGIYERNKPRVGKTSPEDWLDPVCIGYLDAICYRTDAVIVVSSSWRRYLEPHHRLAHVLWLGGLEAPVVGTTPILDPPEAMTPTTRWREITAYLAEHPEVTRWAILDDLDWEGFPPDRFVRTSIETGLVPEQVDRVVAILMV